MTKMQGMRRQPSGHLPPTGRPSTGHPHLPPATGRPSTGLRRAPSQGERDGGLASGRRGSWIAESKSAAPDEAAVRRILADPSAYARPSTAGSSMRAAGAQRLGDSGPTRGSQFRISALERADLECPRCQEQQKTIKTLRHKLLEYKNRCEAPMTTRLSSDLDAEVEGLRTERDALAVRANQLQAKLALLQGILDNQRVEEPNTQLEEEHRRLLLVVAELQKKMSDQQKEHAEEAKRLATQVDAAKAEAGQARTEAQEQRRVARETHENVLQGLAQSVAHAESLQDKLATCQVESAHSKVTSEARYALLLQNFRAAEVQATTAQRQLEVQTDHTRQAQEQASQLSERLREVDARSKELESRMAAADRQVQDMGETLEKTAKQVAVLVTGASKGNEALTAEVARLTAEVARQTEQLRNAASELDAAQAALTETERQSQKLARELADMAGKLKLAQELADNAKSVAAAAQKQLQESEGKIRELESALNKSVVGEKCQKERAEGLQNMLSEKDKVVTALKKEIEKLKEELAAKESAPPENSGTKVVVVTPKITVSMPDGSMRDHGKMGLPKHVLQELVANQLGYTPDELFQVDDVSQLGAIKKPGLAKSQSVKQ